MKNVILIIGIVFVVGLSAARGEDAVKHAEIASSVSIDSATSQASENISSADYALLSDVDALWVCLAAFLVFFMQAGFTLVESGFTRAKNSCNIVMKNVMDFSIGSISFWMMGFGLMFGISSTGLFGTSKFLYHGENGFDWSFLLFQTVFCATAATIVSGAMAERTKFSGYLIGSIAVTALIYPIFGSWCWNGLVNDSGGWLEGGPVLESIFGAGAAFHDFAGSTVVHSIGGWAALAGAIVLGPRIGRYGKNGQTNPIPGHNIPLAALGVFILWLGWFGFNPGSTTAVGGGDFAFIAVTTNLAAAAGAIGAMVISWLVYKKPEPSLTLNGALAGLVAITAGCDAMAPSFAALTGLVAGAIVVGSVAMFDRVRIDDPVGAVSVHGVCGAWGTLAIGLFKTDVGLLVGGGGQQFLVQLFGVIVAFVWAFPTALLVFYAIKKTIGLRVSRDEEVLSLDLSEHGTHAYPPSFLTEPVLRPAHPPRLARVNDRVPARTEA